MTTGYVKWYDEKKGFGFIDSDVGDVFLHRTVVGNFLDQLSPDAAVKFEFITEYKNGNYRRTVTNLLSVVQLETVEVLTTVKHYNSAKNYGFLHTELGRDAFLHGSVCKAAGIIPGEGLPVRAQVEKRRDKLTVTSFVWGPEVEEAYRKLHGVEEAVSATPTMSEDLPEATALDLKVSAKPTPKKASKVKSPEKKPAKPNGVDLQQLVAAGKPNGSFGEQLKAAAAK